MSKKMSKLDRLRYKTESIKLEGTKAELEFKIEEHLHDIERIKDHIKKCEERQQELKNILGGDK